MAGRTKLRVHPLALMFPLAAAMLGERGDVAALLTGLAVHEASHLLAARCLGVVVTGLRLMPFGGAIGLENPYALSAPRLLGVAAAGPLGSALALVAGAALAHWRVVSPALALALTRVNLALLLFNLLPALPLDGGRMLYAMLFPRIGRERAVRAGIWLGRATALLLVAAAAWGWFAFGAFNLTYALAAVFILASARDERAALGDASVGALLSAMRPIHRPVPARLWAVGGDCTVGDALRRVRPDGPTLFAVYKGSRLSSITDDRRLMEAAIRRNVNVKIGEVVWSTKPCWRNEE